MNIYIKNMVSQRCKMVVGSELESLGIDYKKIELGYVEISGKITSVQLVKLQNRLLNSGLELLKNKKKILAERVKNEVTQMVHYSEDLPITNYSVYLSEKVGYDYTYLANTFSEVNGVTIQQFIIRHKMERVKELLLYGELNLTEIADKLNYSSVAHLCNQFKKSTGFTPSVYKALKEKPRKNLENL